MLRLADVTADRPRHRGAVRRALIAQADLAVKLGHMSPQVIEEVLEQVSAAPPQ